MLSPNYFSRSVMLVASLFTLGFTNARCEESTNAEKIGLTTMVASLMAACGVTETHAEQTTNAATAANIPKVATTNPIIQMTVELRDGSRLIGKSLDDPLAFHSASLGDLKLPVCGIASVEFPAEGSNSVAKLTATNGDTLSLQFLPKTLRLETCFGKATLPAKLILSFKVSVSTPSDNTALTNGLLSFWNFDGVNPGFYPPDGGRLTLPLQTGNDGKGQVNPGTVVPGKIGNAINFGGMGYSEVSSRPYSSYGGFGPNRLNQGLFIPAGQFPMLTTFTVTAWVKLNDCVNRGPRSLIASSWDGPDGWDFLFDIFNGQLEARVISLQTIVIDKQVGFYDHQWHFCVFQCLDSQYIRVKVDNKDWTTLPISGSLAGAAPRPFQVGANSAQGIFNSNCRIDMLGVWDRVLSESELAGIYNNGNGLEFPFLKSTP